MKSVFLKYVSALMALWYCLSIIGFDVHSCTVTGSTFVNSVLNGTTCEEVHPEHDCCCHGSCCHSACSHDHEAPSSEEVDENDDCCTNEIEVLDSEGVAAAEDNACDMHDATTVLAFVENDYNSLLRTEAATVSYKPDSGHFRQPDILAVLSIWRI
jgi:hypothetical protein